MNSQIIRPVFTQLISLVWKLIKKYFYRVISGNSVSNIYDFKTPAISSQEEPINIVVMSDMQRDGNNPNKFHQIVHDGIFEYIHTHYDTSISEGLNMLMIPGDLVNTGTDYYHWKDQFFGPALPIIFFSTIISCSW